MLPNVLSFHMFVSSDVKKADIQISQLCLACENNEYIKHVMILGSTETNPTSVYKEIHYFSLLPKRSYLSTFSTYLNGTAYSSFLRNNSFN